MSGITPNAIFLSVVDKELTVHSVQVLHILPDSATLSLHSEMRYSNAGGGSRECGKYREQVKGHNETDKLKDGEN